MYCHIVIRPLFTFFIAVFKSSFELEGVCTHHICKICCDKNIANKNKVTLIINQQMHLYKISH